MAALGSWLLCLRLRLLRLRLRLLRLWRLLRLLLLCRRLPQPSGCEICEQRLCREVHAAGA